VYLASADAVRPTGLITKSMHTLRLCKLCCAVQHKRGEWRASGVLRCGLSVRPMPSVTRFRYQHPTCKEAVPPCAALDPEGLFATAGAACSVFIGLLFGFLMLQVHSGARSCVSCKL